MLLNLSTWESAARAAPAQKKSVDVKLHDLTVKVTASSVLSDPQNPGRYGPANLLDEDPGTIWAEGAKTTGAGEWVDLRFPPKARVRAFLIAPGNPKSAELYQANARPRKARLDLKLVDRRKLSYSLDFPKNFPAGGALYAEYREEGVIESARLTVVSVWPGSKYKDLCLGTFVPVFEGPEQEDMFTFLGNGQELAPTIAAFLIQADLTTRFVPPEESGKAAWLLAYREIPSDRPLPEAVQKIDMVHGRLETWDRYRTALAQDIAGARNQSNLFVLSPVAGEATYQLTPADPPTDPESFSNFQVRWSRDNGKWLLTELHVAFREETPDD